MAPVEGSGAWPVWMQAVENPNLPVWRFFPPADFFAIWFLLLSCAAHRRSVWNSAIYLLFAAFKNILRHVAFGGIGDDCHNTLPFPEFFCHLDCCENIGSRAGTAQNAFQSSQLRHGIERVLIGDHDYFITHGRIKSLGNKTGANAFHFVGSFGTAAQNGSFSLHGSTKHAGQLLFHKARYAGKCSAGTNADDDSINGALHLFKD